MASDLNVPEEYESTQCSSQNMSSAESRTCLLYSTTCVILVKLSRKVLHTVCHIDLYWSQQGDWNMSQVLSCNIVGSILHAQVLCYMLFLSPSLSCLSSALFQSFIWPRIFKHTKNLTSSDNDEQYEAAVLATWRRALAALFVCAVSIYCLLQLRVYVAIGL